MLRSMRESDLELIADLFTFANPQSTKSEIYNYTLDVLKEYPTLCWVYEEVNHIIGAITGIILKDRNVGYIMDISVAIEARNRGVGRKLITHFESVITKFGIRKIILGIHYENAEVVPFYYCLGYRLDGVKLDDFGKDQDAIEMKKILK